MLLVAMVMATGCGNSVGPSSDETRAAMQVAWGSSMAMEMAAAPEVVWLPDGVCHHELADEPQGTLSDLDNCVAGSADSRGIIEVVWTGSFSGSNFSRELAKYRSWLLNTNWIVDPVVVDSANHALISAGM